MKYIEEIKTEEINVSNTSFKDRLEFAFLKTGVSKNWVAEKLGISKQMLNYLLKHSTKPKFTNEISELLKINNIWLETGTGIPFPSEKKEEEIKIPVFTEKNIGDFFDKKYKPMEYIYFTSINNKNIIALKINDDSLFPPFLDGSILIFDKDIKPKNKNYVLIKNLNHYLVRQLIVSNNQFIYQTKNDKYETILHSEIIIIVGTLIEARFIPE